MRLIERSKHRVMRPVPKSADRLLRRAIIRHASQLIARLIAQWYWGNDGRLACSTATSLQCFEFLLDAYVLLTVCAHSVESCYYYCITYWAHSRPNVQVLDAARETEIEKEPHAVKDRSNGTQAQTPARPNGISVETNLLSLWTRLGRSNEGLHSV